MGAMVNFILVFLNSQKNRWVFFEEFEEIYFFVTLCGPLVNSPFDLLGFGPWAQWEEGGGVTNIEQFFVLKKSQTPGRLVFFVWT